MHKIMMLALLLLVSAAWLSAQQSYPQSEAGQTGGPAAGQSTVEGCLQGSAGSYTLTDKNGTTFQLTGDTSKLAEHVGHEVQITGNTSWSNAASSTGGASSMRAQQGTIDVKSMKHISKSCKSAAK